MRGVDYRISARVGLPYFYISRSRAGIFPTCLTLFTDVTDPALHAIFLPAALTCIAYSYVFLYCEVNVLAHYRLTRWPVASAATILSLWAEMCAMFNSFRP